MLLLQRKPQFGSRLLLVAIITIGVGLLYVGWQFLAPAARIIGIDPVDNPTTQQISRSVPNENRLYVPSLNVSIPYGVTAGSLEKGAWWRKPQNGNPKDGGNFVLAAHRFTMSLTPGETIKKSPFYYIDRLKQGDQVVVDYEGVRYRYVIDHVSRVTPNQIQIEERTDDDRLTLYSCTLKGSADGREVIVARPIAQ